MNGVSLRFLHFSDRSARKPLPAASSAAAANPKAFPPITTAPSASFTRIAGDHSIFQTLVSWVFPAATREEVAAAAAGSSGSEEGLPEGQAQLPLPLPEGSGEGETKPPSNVAATATATPLPQQSSLSEAAVGPDLLRVWGEEVVAEVVAAARQEGIAAIPALPGSRAAASAAVAAGMADSVAAAGPLASQLLRECIETLESAAALPVQCHPSKARKQRHSSKWGGGPCAWVDCDVPAVLTALTAAAKAYATPALLDTEALLGCFVATHCIIEDVKAITAEAQGTRARR